MNAAEPELIARIRAELDGMGLAGSATESLCLMLAHNAVTAETTRDANASLASLARVMAQIGALLPRTIDEADALTQHMRAL